MNLESFILAFILWMDPLVKHIEHEDPSARLERLKAISADMAEVCQDPKEAPVFDGDSGRIKTCMLLASIAYNESGFKLSVDNGTDRGDGGRSVCIMQVQHGQNGKMKYTASDLLDRKTCIRAGLKVLRASKCNDGSDMANMLRGYVNGSCKEHEDPKKDKIIAETSLADARGFINYINKFKKLPKIKEEN